jgi:sugar lactone lactonase YvrE
LKNAILALLATLPLLAQPYVISTIAGGAPPPTPAAAVNASFPLPPDVAADSSGNVYFTAVNCVFKIDASGTMTRVAGTARAGSSGDGGPATSAQLNNPYGLALDGSGNLYIADSGNNRVRKVAANGVITTIAGTGVAGYFGDNGPAISAQFDAPLGLALDSAGNLYIADSYNQRIRKLTLNGVIATVAGNGTSGYGGDNASATAAELYQPEGVAVDSAGNLYIADLGNYRVRKVNPAGVITTVAGTGANGVAGDGGAASSAQLEFPWAVAVDGQGNFYVADSNRVRKVAGGVISTVAGSTTSGFSGDGAAATKALLDQPYGLFVDASGNLYIADTGNNRIRKVTSNGNISTIAGNGLHNYSGDNGPATSAQLYNPQAVAIGSSGNLYITDYARLRGISPAGVITTIAGNGISNYSGDNGPATSAGLNQPEGVAVDASGNIYLSDSSNRVREVTTSGTISTFTGNGTQSQLDAPDGLAMDASGNLYIADSGNARVQKVTPAGVVSTVAGNGTQGYAGDGGPATSAELTFPRGLAVDVSGNLYIADFGNNCVRKVSPIGTITTIAGNISPQGVAVDASGNLYIADFNNVVWKLPANGAITAIAGNGTKGYSGDGRNAATAQLNDARGIAVDASGNVYVADTSNYAIRMLRPIAALLSITTPSPLPPGSVGAPYSQQFAATGGMAPYAWLVVSGALPSGLTLSGSGLLSGTLAAPATSTFTIQVTDSQGSIATKAFSLTVSAPAITTPSPLLQGVVGLNYSQTLSATGGSPPYAWTLASGSLPPGLALSTAGVITGVPSAAGTSTFTVQVADASSVTATQSFTITVIATPPLARSGVLAHIAAGGGWTTTLYLANTSGGQIAVSLAFHADDGSALSLPVNVTLLGATQSVTAPSVYAIVNNHATLVIDTGSQLAATVTGWVDVQSSGSLSGFAVFGTTQNGAASSGTSPLQTQFFPQFELPYDNRAGFVTAVAVANLTAAATTITATAWDSTGVQIAQQSIPLAANGHTSFLLPAQISATGNIQGIVQFQSSSGSLGGVGLLVNPQGSFTTIPIILP